MVMCLINICYIKNKILVLCTNSDWRVVQIISNDGTFIVRP